jgi:hypothetical protein
MMREDTHHGSGNKINFANAQRQSDPDILIHEKLLLIQLKNLSSSGASLSSHYLSRYELFRLILRFICPEP